MDLDAAVFRETRDLDGGARGGRRREIRGVDLVHFGEVVHVGEIDRGGHDPVERAAAGLQDRVDVLEDLPGLRLDAPLDQVAGRRIERDLPRAEQQPSDGRDGAFRRLRGRARKK